MNWCVYSALRDCQNLHRDRLSDCLAMGYTATTTTTATAGTTVSFPVRFRTVQAYFAPNFEIDCVHAWILTLITRLAITLSTTTIPAAIVPPLPLAHLGISVFAFKSNWDESRWRVRN